MAASKDCARGGFEVDIRWHDGALTHAAIHSRTDAPCRVRYGGARLDLDIAAGERYELERIAFTD